MDQHELLLLLQQVAKGNTTPENAAKYFKMQPFTDLGFAKVDNHRALRQGAPEVIFGSGKTAEQIIGIVQTLQQNGQSALITRMDASKADQVSLSVPLEYDPVSHIGVVGAPFKLCGGLIVIVSGGTSDQPVAEEAALTAEFFGNTVERLYDVGVAGLHRLLSQIETLQRARVIIAVAGMEGALASVVGGLVDCPVIAVPTSVGYGANFGGVSALLSMLNSCASGVSVVNIDNGFGAGFLASRINQIGDREI